MNDRDKFVDWAVECGHEEVCVWEFLWLIQAPDRFGGFYQIAENLLKVIPILNKYENDINKLKVDLESWKRICESVIDSREELEEIFGEIISSKLDRKTLRPPTYGQMGKSPIATALYSRHEDELLEGRQYMIGAIVLIGQMYKLKKHDVFSIVNFICYEGKGSFIFNLSSSFSKIGKMMREFTYSDNSSRLVKLTNVQVTTVNEYYKWVLEAEKRDPENQSINEMRVYLSRVLCDEDPDDWGGKGGHVGSKGVERYGNGEIGSFIVINNKDKDNYCRKVALSKDLDKELSVAGVSDEEIVDEIINGFGGDGYYLSKDSLKPVSATLSVSATKQRYVAIGNNNLETRWSSLTRQECQVVIDELMSLLDIYYKDIIESNGERNCLIKLEGCLLLVAMVVTGSSFNRALKIVLLLKENEQVSDISYLTDAQCWRVKVNVPKRRSKEKIDEALFYDKEEYLLLEDFYGLNKYFGLLANERCNRGKCFFSRPRKNKKFAHVMNQIIKKLQNKVKRLKLNKSQLEKIIQYSVVTVTGGSTVCSEYITGTNRFSAKVQKHYAMLTPEYLACIYRRSIARVDGKVDASIISVDNSDVKRISSWRCAKEKAIKQVLYKLRQDLKSKEHIRTISELIVFHNKYTLYVLIAFLITTSYRCAINPQANPELITRDGLLFFGDKVSDDCYQERVAWVHDDVMMQLEEYKVHRLIVLEELYLRFKEGTKYFNNNEVFLFFVDEKQLKPIEVRPTTWNEQVEDLFPVEMNFSRSLMMSKLMMEGCPTDIRRAYMGHTVCGRESYGKYSALSPLIYKKAIAGYLNRMFEEIEFQVIGGFDSVNV